MGGVEKLERESKAERVKVERIRIAEVGTQELQVERQERKSGESRGRGKRDDGREVKSNREREVERQAE